MDVLAQRARNRLRRCAVCCAVALFAVACGGLPPPAGVPGAPRTLEGAISAVWEKTDRYLSGDYTGEWLLYSKALRDAISQDDYATYAAACADNPNHLKGAPFTLMSEGMDGDETAVIRVGFNGVEHSRTMIYELGYWVQAPSAEMMANFGKPVAQWKCESGARFSEH